MFVEVRDPNTNKLLFKYDAERDLIQHAARGQVTLVDLKDYRPGGKVASPLTTGPRPTW